MKSLYSFFIVGLSIAGVTSALPADNSISIHSLLKRGLTPDNTCGNKLAGLGNNFTCDASIANGGPCCSSNGYCGIAADYCGIGCQSLYGTCAGVEGGEMSTFVCGPKNNNLKCGDGLCCSSAGFCGNTTDYCSNGCQQNFGKCNAPEQGFTDLCGPQNNNARCAPGQCCSQAGFCGTTKDFCADPDCQFQFGTCDSDKTPTGASTLNDPRPLVGDVSYDDDLYSCTKEKVVALTFDDGPAEFTSQLLDILKKYGFTATFFITGNNLGKGQIDTTAAWTSVVKRMNDEGHQIASHTWSHYSLSNVTSEMRKLQMTKNERAIANIIGKYPTYMRPPYSQCSPESGCTADMKALGYHRTYFDLDTQDYLNPLPIQVQASKDIVAAALNDPQFADRTDYLSIQHDIGQQSVTNLTAFFFDQIKAKGWKGVTVGECLGDAPNNWYRTPGGSAVSSSVSSGPGPTSATSSSGASFSAVPSGSGPATSQTTSSGLTSAVPTTPTSKGTSTVSSQPSGTKPFPPKGPPSQTPAKVCDVQSGPYCGKIPAFDSYAKCWGSVADCMKQTQVCTTTKGTAKHLCAKMGGICAKLTVFCFSCRFTGCFHQKFKVHGV